MSLDIKSGNPWPSSELSNFTPRVFFFRGVRCHSMEGLLQALKFQDEATQHQVCLLSGARAKKKGREAPDWRTTQVLWWAGRAIYRRSNEYAQLITEAYSDMYEQCPGFREALQATGNQHLTHSIGRNNLAETVLTVTEFVMQLNTLRERLYADLAENASRPHVEFIDSFPSSAEIHRSIAIEVGEPIDIPQMSWPEISREQQAMCSKLSEYLARFAAPGGHDPDPHLRNMVARQLEELAACLRVKID